MCFCSSFHPKPLLCATHGRFYIICFPRLGTPGYVPPVSNFDGESTDGIAQSFTVPVTKAKKSNCIQLLLYSMLLLFFVLYLNSCGLFRWCRKEEEGSW